MLDINAMVKLKSDFLMSALINIIKLIPTFQDHRTIFEFIHANIKPSTDRNLVKNFPFWSSNREGARNFYFMQHPLPNYRILNLRCARKQKGGKAGTGDRKHCRDITLGFRRKVSDSRAKIVNLDRVAVYHLRPAIWLTYLISSSQKKTIISYYLNGTKFKECMEWYAIDKLIIRRIEDNWNSHTCFKYLVPRT